ncbi:peptidoglycan-binding protein [Phenylobacterium sp.]|uniref:peptidoglycan-binding protein n=1 Tax=Phenylobacterium sp. TaxID=1871053 RepID=UPI0025DE3B7D|nr:peptidoglycan-binding protein [Phenylobacterium sp.]
MTLGEWLNRMILEDDAPDEITSQSYFDERPARSDRAQFETARAPEAAPAAVTEPSAGRYEPVQQSGDEMGRVALALDRLSGRFDRAEPRLNPASLAAESVMREAMARIEAAERDAIAVAARFEGAVQEARAENTRLAERLRRVEAEAAGPRSAEALRSLEAALGKVANHLYEGEGRTRDTLHAMEQRIDQIFASGGGDPASLLEEVVDRVDARLTDAETRTSEALVNLGQAFANLDSRMGAGEKAVVPEVERRIETLAATLSRRVEDVRGEIAEAVRKSEQASGEAIERMGREVLTVADTLNRQVQAAEHRSADAIEQVGGEVARIAQAMEQRLGRSEGAHAEALEKLGAEIGRITDRLTERIGSSERRSAQAIDDVGEQVARVSERISQRQERSSEDLAERIRQSEERTARLLDEARGTIDRSLAESHRRASEQSLAAAAAPAAPRLTREEPTASPFDHDPFRELGPVAETRPESLVLQAFAAAEPPADSFNEATSGTEWSEEAAEPPVAADFPETANAPVFDAVDFEAADGFDPIESSAEAEPSAEAELLAEAELIEADVEPDVEAAASESLDVELPEPPASEPGAGADPFAQSAWTSPADLASAPEAEEASDAAEAVGDPARPLSTREVIEQARAAARAASGPGGDAKRKGGKIEKLPRREKEGGRSLFSGLSLRKRAVGSSSLQTALLVAGGAAFLSLAATSYFITDAEPSGAPPKRVADALAVFASDQAGEIAGGEADTAPNPSTVRAAVALAPQPITAPGTPAPAAAASVEDPAAVASLYAEALRALETSEPGGLEKLRKAANLGHSPAQFYLAKLYTDGGAGLKKDPVEARRWTERAAEGGNRAAMHNLGIALAQGQGGPKNLTLAAEWFRKAADLGLVDSQYNLGVLYEQGRGVTQNAAEAYKWYLIAARSRDELALDNAARVRAGLSAEARSVSERSARGFRPVSPNTSAAATPTSSSNDVATAQRALSRLAYYQGPTDGSVSPALTMAIAAYQRHQGMAATGSLDPVTLSRLQVFTR